MKRILYIAAMVSLLMTSCQKTEVLNVVEDTIDFSTEVGKLTKAIDYSGTKYETLTGQGFKVWAFADFSLGNDVDGTIYRGIDGLWVRYQNGWGIAGNQKYFWPQSGNYLQFYALSYKHDNGWASSLDSKTHLLPAVTAGTDNTVPAKSTEITGLDLPVYTVCPEANDDIMVADHIRQDKSVTKTVSPLFRHTMTKVEFYFKKGGEASDTDAEEASVIILKGITTDPLANKGSLDVTYSNADSNTDFSFDWVADATATKTPFYGVPSDTLTIVKKGGAIVATVTEAPIAVGTENEGDLCVLVADNSRTIYAYAKADESSNPTWTVVETHTYNKSSKEWESNAEKPAYETFVGKVLTDNSVNFVTWYMIPQTIDLVETEGEEAGRVKIDYVADGVHIEQYFGLKGEVVSEWIEELCVKYNVTVAPHKIQFSPTVGEWDPLVDKGMVN